MEFVKQVPEQLNPVGNVSDMPASCMAHSGHLLVLLEQELTT